MKVRFISADGLERTVEIKAMDLPPFLRRKLNAHTVRLYSRGKPNCGVETYREVLEPAPVRLTYCPACRDGCDLCQA